MHRSMNINHFKKGFTLLELLVVISIIGILATVVLALFSSGVKTKTNDTKVKAQIVSMREAIALYNANNGNYGTLTQGACTGMFSSTTANLNNLTNSANYPSNTNLICKTDGVNAWAVAGKLSGGYYFCVDSAGNLNTQTAYNAGTDPLVVGDSSYTCNFPPQPPCTISSFTGTNVTTYGSVSSLNWAVSNSINCTSATISGIGGVNYSGSVSNVSAGTYTLTVNGPAGGDTRQVTVITPVWYGVAGSQNDVDNYNRLLQAQAAASAYFSSPHSTTFCGGPFSNDYGCWGQPVNQCVGPGSQTPSNSMFLSISSYITRSNYGTAGSGMSCTTAATENIGAWPNNHQGVLHYMITIPMTNGSWCVDGDGHSKAGTGNPSTQTC